MSSNGKMLILLVVSLILIGIGLADFFTVDPYSYIQGEDHTIVIYVYIGVALLILSIVSLVRQNRKIK